jgi:ribosomal protein L32
MAVIPFKKSQEQHGSGPAFCIACAHEWVAVAPTGVTALECPACKTQKGRYRFEFTPPEGQMVRECDCGNQLFYMTLEGHLCANCGIYQGY